MTPAALDVTRRLAEHPRWRWGSGMLVTAPGWLEYATILEVGVDGRPEEWVYRGHLRGPGSPSGDVWDFEGAYPDLNDSATGGVLMARVWESDPGAMVRRDPGRPPGVAPYTVGLSQAYEWRREDGHTLGEAAGRALLAAWQCGALPPLVFSEGGSGRWVDVHGLEGRHK